MEHIENNNEQCYKFICEKCVFFSNNRNDYNRHLKTNKHNNESKKKNKIRI